MPANAMSGVGTMKYSAATQRAKDAAGKHRAGAQGAQGAARKRADDPKAKKKAEDAVAKARANMKQPAKAKVKAKEKEKQLKMEKQREERERKAKAREEKREQKAAEREAAKKKKADERAERKAQKEAEKISRTKEIAVAAAKPAGKTSKYRGVSLDRSSGKFFASMRRDGIKVALGRFATEMDAARAYDKASAEAGKVKTLNFPDEHQEAVRAAEANEAREKEAAEAAKTAAKEAKRAQAEKAKKERQSAKRGKDKSKETDKKAGKEKEAKGEPPKKKAKTAASAAAAKEATEAAKAKKLKRTEEEKMAAVAESEKKASAGNRSSKFRGVSWRKASGKWAARVYKGHGKYKEVGVMFDTEAEAASAHDEAATSLYGDKAILNFQSDGKTINPLRFAYLQRESTVRNTTTKLRGVTKLKKGGAKPYVAQISFRSRMISIGSFATAEEASKAYTEKAAELRSMEGN